MYPKNIRNMAANLERLGYNVTVEHDADSDSTMDSLKHDGHGDLVWNEETLTFERELHTRRTYIIRFEHEDKTYPTVLNNVHGVAYYGTVQKGDSKESAGRYSAGYLTQGASRAKDLNSPSEFYRWADVSFPHYDR